MRVILDLPDELIRSITRSPTGLSLERQIIELIRLGHKFDTQPAAAEERLDYEEFANRAISKIEALKSGAEFKVRDLYDMRDHAPGFNRAVGKLIKNKLIGCDWVDSARVNSSNITVYTRK